MYISSKNISISFHNLSAMITPKKIKNISFASSNNQSTFRFPHLFKKVFKKICLLKLGNKQHPNIKLTQSKPSSTSYLSTYLFIIILYYIKKYILMRYSRNQVSWPTVPTLPNSKFLYLLLHGIIYFDSLSLYFQ